LDYLEGGIDGNGLRCDRGLVRLLRYEVLVRISNSIRARKEPQDLFEVLVNELRK